MPSPLARRLGLTVPIVQAPMAGGWTTPELVAGVAEAGGLGMLAGGRVTADRLRDLIRATRRLTARPFGLNLQVPIISPEEASRPGNPEPLRRLRVEHGLPPDPAGSPTWVGPDEAAAIALAEGIRILSVVMGPAGSWLSEAHGAGALVMATVTTVAEALEVEAGGVDVVVAQGSEAGGHRSTFRPGAPDRWPLIGTMALVPQVVDAVKLPVIAAGGIMDGRGVMAALALGAEAAQLGTRFLLARESGATPAYRRRLLEADETATVVTDAYTGRPARAIRNRFLQRMADQGGTPLPWPRQGALGAELYRASLAEDGEWAPLLAGQGLRLADREQGAADIMRDLTATAREVRARLADW
ncbi:MAG TPA: nitronate monooxygenase [Gemmatimonadales bacterium]|nr:nitronate monooxygenase [Gemmatimonadales bacterium]